MAETTVIKKCDCTGTPGHASKFQDKKYGYGMRLCNITLKRDSAKCTVCGKLHRL